LHSKFQEYPTGLEKQPIQLFIFPIFRFLLGRGRCDRCKTKQHEHYSIIKSSSGDDHRSSVSIFRPPQLFSRFRTTLAFAKVSLSSFTSLKRELDFLHPLY
jgi:hypothetical protein